MWIGHLNNTDLHSEASRIGPNSANKLRHVFVHETTCISGIAVVKVMLKQPLEPLWTPRMDRCAARDPILPGLRIAVFPHSGVIPYLIDEARHGVRVLGLFYGGQEGDPPCPGKTIDSLEWLPR